MEGRALRILATLLALAMLGFWYFRPTEKTAIPPQAGILPPGADARVEGVKLLQSGPQGELSLVSRDAEWSRESQNFRLNGVDITFMVAGTGGHATRGHLSGERGDAATDAKEFSLEGKVVAETFDGYRLETSDVRYHHETRQVETEAPVSLEGPGLRVSGRGASVDYRDQRVEIRGRVRAHLVPAILEEHMPSGLNEEKLR